MKAFLDTNILLYAVELHRDENAKTATAQGLVARTDWAISVQVCQEFFVQATRRSRPNRLSAELATGLIASWRRQPVQDMTLAIFDDAVALHRRHGFSYWDCAIIAAARAQGCEVLWTEDMDDGRVVEGMRVANPFR